MSIPGFHLRGSCTLVSRMGSADAFLVKRFKNDTKVEQYSGTHCPDQPLTISYRCLHYPSLFSLLEYLKENLRKPVISPL